MAAKVAGWSDAGPIVATTRVRRGDVPRQRRDGLEAPASPGTEGQSRRSSWSVAFVGPGQVGPGFVGHGFLGHAFVSVVAALPAALASVTPPALPIRGTQV